MASRPSSCVALVLAALLVGAGCSGREDGDGPADAGGGTDASAPGDAGGGEDAAVGDDAGAPADAGEGSDAGPPDAGDDEPDAGPPDAGAECELGQLCNDTQPCPGDLRCYGFGGNGFCAPFTPECGGFADIHCAAGRTCLRGGGGSLGYCALPPETVCICTSAATEGFSVDGC